MNYLTDERLAEIRIELAHDLWPSRKDSLAMVEELQERRRQECEEIIRLREEIRMFEHFGK